MSADRAPRQLELFSDLSDTGSQLVHSPPSASPKTATALPPSETTATESTPSAEALTSLASELAAGLGLRKLANRVSVHWNRRMRTTAGRAHYEALRIELNPGLIDLPGIDGAAEVDRTLRHELAHLVAHLRARGKRIDPHGPEWRRACADLGIPGEARCHTLPFRTRQIRRKYLYRCPACGTEVPRVRKFKRAVACYACCRQHNSGHYDDRFRLKAVRQKSR